MIDKDFQFIKSLSEAFGPSGSEVEVKKIIAEKVAPHVTSLIVDRLGNLIAKKGDGGNVVLSAHMDEVAFMVTGISDDGTLCFSQIGGIDPRSLPSKRVCFPEKDCFGVIGSRPIHLNKDANEKITYYDLYIDIGATTKAEAENLVSPGDFAVFNTKTERQNGKDSSIKGKAFDDRLGCYLLCKLIENPNISNCTFVFTVQEETGLLGASEFAINHSYEYGIAVDVTTPNDLPGISGPRTVCRLNHGPVISFADGRCIYDQDLVSSVFSLLESNKIRCQTKAMRTGGNEASSFRNAGRGMKTLSVSVPCRYIHGPVGVFYENDLVESEKALLCILSKIQNGGKFND